MNYRALKARVAAAERRVGEHLDDAGRQYNVMRNTTREAITPTRLLLSGLIGGFVIGLVQPMKHVGGITSLLRMLQSTQPLLTSLIPLLNLLRETRRSGD